MGIMNLIKGKWDGKVGELVGAKWKNRSTIRSFTPPANPNTPAQQKIRGVFGAMTEFVALFAPDLKGLSALDVRGKSVRNAIIALNKALFASDTFDPEQLQISKGGLPVPSGTSISWTAATGALDISWRPVVGQNVSTKARTVWVIVNATKKTSVVLSALNTAGSVTGTLAGAATDTGHAYYYLLDFRGSAKVASISTREGLSPS